MDSARIKVTSRDVQEIISKLTSDKAKTRDEGIKLLGMWMLETVGDRSKVFCRYLSDKTASLKHNETFHSETWPFLVKILIQCISLEISSSKKRLPKINYAKALKVVINRAEDVEYSGKKLLLLPVAKLIFNHVCDVIMDGPSFQSEYVRILQCLLPIKDYRFHLRKRVYASLVVFHMKKVETSLITGKSNQTNPHDDPFRTLQLLLENPPGDFADDIREDVVKGFVAIFQRVRNEDNNSRKLMDCINIYLLKDGPNMGCKSLEIHEEAKKFVFQRWFNARDKKLKESFVIYAKLQLSLMRGSAAADGTTLLAQFLDVVSKELDQICNLGTSLLRTDSTLDARDEKRYLTRVVELAALIFCRACSDTSKAPTSEKRPRQECLVVQIKERLMEGKWAWHAVLCYLICNYSTRVNKDIFIYWFENLSANFERIINKANMEHPYDGLLWTLRSLLELSSLLLFAAPNAESLRKSSVPISEVEKGWRVLWNCLMHVLPMFVKIPTLVDAALMILCNILLTDTKDSYSVSLEMWDLQMFKHSPSISVLCFISCYFSRRASQYNSHDAIYTRQTMLRAVLMLLSSKESLPLDMRLIVAVPAAAFAVCVGSAPLLLESIGLSRIVYFPEQVEEMVKAGELPIENMHSTFECSVEILAKINKDLVPQVSLSEHYQHMRLPGRLKDQLLHEMENYILDYIKDKESRTESLSEIIGTCALLSNFMYCSYSTRIREEASSFFSNLGKLMLTWMDRAISVVDKTCNDIVSGGLGITSVFGNIERTVDSFKSLLCSPLLNKWEGKNDTNAGLYLAIVQSAERLLSTLAKLYEGCSGYMKNLNAKLESPNLSEILNVHDPVRTNSSQSLLDMDLDADRGPIDADSLTNDTDHTSGITKGLVSHKLALVSIMSGFFSILPVVAWEILFNLQVKESDPKVLENILLILCQHPQWSSSSQLLDLIMSMAENVNLSEDLRLHSSDMLGCICRLVESLLHLDSVGNYVALSARKLLSDECFRPLGDLVHNVLETRSLDWLDRAKLVVCICNFVLLRPQIAQTMIEKLFVMLRDPDYRVRLCLARRIGVLFQTWDGHVELFQDICSNFGVKLVNYSREKIVQAEEVLSVGPQPREIMETTILTIMHLVLHSEKIELEAIFLICAVAAIDPSQRELVGAVLDSLSKELSYMDRTKYMEELMGPILFCWTACSVSLVALVETRDLFVSNVEPINFVQYCCQWLLPALILQEDYSNLEWVAKVARQTCAELVKHHFVHIFSICMALHCSKKPGCDKGSRALGYSILRIGEISEHDRDELVWKFMVSTVNHILSLASSLPDPPLPFFSKDTIACAIVTVVDGFLDSEGHSTSIHLIDKIHVFRPDRVFMFIVDIHYKVTAAVRQSHERNHFAAIEVLVDLLGHRAILPSTFNYLLNLIGQFIGSHSLMDQCCQIMSTLLQIFQDNPFGETIRLLGERLQFLVSELIECCTRSESCGEPPSAAPPNAVSLLHQLTIGSNPSLHEYIKELEPFPDIDLFDEVRGFHMEISRSYSPRVHLLNLVKRSYHVSPRLILYSLKALHMQIFTSEIHRGAENDENVIKDIDWHSDNEIVHAVWNLVKLCSVDDTNNLSAIVSDFVSRIGIRDPHRVVFDLSGEFNGLLPGLVKGGSSADANIRMDTGVSDEVLLILIRLLKKYLMDQSVEIIDMSLHALRGILSTEKGRRMLLKLDSYESSLIEVHSNGANLETVLSLINNLQQKFDAESMSIEDSTVWTTSGKTFDAWIRPLVCVLISYCDDHILRLCQDIVLVKSEVSELLFSSVMVNLSRRNSSEIDLCKIISLKVQENIFIESNALVKSIQILLNALNELRLYHVMERSKSSSVLQKPRNSKQTKPTGSMVKSRTTSVKVKDLQTPYSESVTPILVWDKVYWLAVDYLTIAKSAIDCGSYFTAVLYVEYWCEEHFNGLSLGTPDFSHQETLPPHIEILVSAVTQINEPDSLYGIIRSHKLTSQIITFEHEGNWSKALEYYDLQVRSEPILQPSVSSYSSPENSEQASHESYKSEHGLLQKRTYKGLIRSLQHIGCTHVLDMYCQGLTSQRGRFQHDLEFLELQYEAAWRGGNWDFSPLYSGVDAAASLQYGNGHHFNENLHSCLRALQEGEFDEFRTTLEDSKQTLLVSMCHASKERTDFMYSTILKLQIFYHLGMAWDLRWRSSYRKIANSFQRHDLISEPIVPSKDQLQWLHNHWNCILTQAELHMNLLEPFIAFRRVLLQVLGSSDSSVNHLLESASILRKASRFSEAAAALHEFKFLCSGMGEVHSNLYWLGRLEEAKLLRAQGQHEMAINLADHISQNNLLSAESADVLRLVGKWLAETRSSNSRTILEKFLKKAVTVAEDHKSTAKLSIEKINHMHFHLAHYADALFRSHEERLGSNEWQVAMRLRRHKAKELDALVKRYKSTTEGDKTDYSLKIQELQKQLTMDREEADKLQEDRDNFLCTALEGYKRCLIIGEKYDIQVVFRLVSLWFSLSNRQIVVDSMLSTIKEVQSYKFILLVYQIASRMAGSGDSSGLASFQFALVSLVKKMSLDHPYHTIFQLLALANGDRIKDKQRSRNSFVVDMDKKVAAEDLLKELSSYHGSTITQMKQMVEVYIKLAELETKREDTNKKVALPRELRSIRELELVPVITSYVPVDRTCQYPEGIFPHFRGLTDSITVMNGINAPKVVECLGSDGKRYRQLAKSGNDDLRQDAVMEQFFGLVNTFLQNNRDTWKRRLKIRTYKVVPFTPSAGVLEWVNGTFPLGEYLIGSSRNGGAHGRYGVGDWNFLKCRQHMSAETDKCKAFQEVCENFRPVMHHFFLERFPNPVDWFDKRLAYTRSIAASSMVGYIVGLGDRHSMNVLIDQATAEVVHIDLGVAFEQGLMLKTPERVPFRLTRDIIDGMGVTGTEGVFRRCCEETLSVMRSNKEALLTIIEVFIHDPLYKWALSPLKAMQRQKDMDDDMGASFDDSNDDGYEGNKDAARALLRVKQKLDGYEDGEMRSVRGQVQQLVQDAIDPDRLCNMFPGWGAWM